MMTDSRYVARHVYAANTEYIYYYTLTIPRYYDNSGAKREKEEKEGKGGETERKRERKKKEGI